MHTQRSTHRQTPQVPGRRVLGQHGLGQHGLGRRGAVLGMLTVVVVATAACAGRTHVELDSAQGPAVQLVDGAGGQNDAAVVDAGVVEIGNLPMPITTPAPATVAPSDQAATSTTSQPAPDEPGDDQAGTDPAAAMIAEFCSTGRRNLLVAVETFRDEFGSPPTSELDLLAAGYVRELSEVFDVRVDGSIVAADETCGA